MNQQDQEILGLSSSNPGACRITPISASQSLHATAAPTRPGAISTGLHRLDEALSPSSSSTGEPAKQQRGIQCGHVSEIFGPPGAGKTTVALSTAVNALRAGGKVVWIDTGSPLPTPRLKHFLESAAPTDSSSRSSSSSSSNLADNIIHFRPPSLPHLLALLLRPPATFPPPDTTLLVLDSVSAPFPSYYPNATDLKTRQTSKNQTRVDKSQLHWRINRKWNVTGDLAQQLRNMAATHRFAVLVVNQTFTRVKGVARPVLSPATAGGVWEKCVFARVALYWDFWGAAGNKARFAEVLKCDGRFCRWRSEGNVVPFGIEMDGLYEISNNVDPPQLSSFLSSFPVSSPPPPPPPPPPLPLLPPQDPSSQASGTEIQSAPSTQRKRKVDEIADSQDEDDDEEED